MACYRQLFRYIGDDGGLKFRSIRHLKDKGLNVEQFKQLNNADVITCGSCYGCKVRKTLDWSLRCMHELQMHDDIGCFLTLTYDDDNIPSDGGLVKAHLRAFHDSLRKKLKRKGIKSYKYYQCGEYGEISNRPHYHMIIFGYKPHDIQPYFQKNGYQTWTSDVITKSWKKGMCVLGDVTRESCAYVAKYCQKKITGDMAQEHYARFDSETGETWQVLPEFQSVSNKPRGIGFEWFEQFYKSDVFPRDEIAFQGKLFPVPRYYYETLEELNPELFERVKDQRNDARLYKDLNLEIEEAARVEKVRLAEVERKLLENGQVI